MITYIVHTYLFILAPNCRLMHITDQFLASHICESSWADPVGGKGGLDPPLKNHKNKGFLSNTGLDPLTKSQSYQVSTQFWATIGTPAGGSMMARLDSLSGICLDSLSPLKNNKKKNVIRVGPPLTKLSESPHDL